MDAPLAADPSFVLLVDDDVAATRLLARMLREDGFAVEIANDGATAIGRLTNGRRPRVLVVDYKLPHADGLVVASFARQRFPGLPIVLVTSWAELVARSGVVLEPAPFVLDKPLDYAALVKLLGQIAAPA